MSGTDVSPDASAQTLAPAAIDMNLEVVTLPVSDVDRAKRFYQTLGWRLDADIVCGDAFRVVPSFRGPDGSTWLLHEITMRLPGRESEE